MKGKLILFKFLNVDLKKLINLSIYRGPRNATLKKQAAALGLNGDFSSFLGSASAMHHSTNYYITRHLLQQQQVLSAYQQQQTSPHSSPFTPNSIASSSSLPFNSLTDNSSPLSNLQSQQLPITTTSEPISSLTNGNLTTSSTSLLLNNPLLNTLNANLSNNLQQQTTQTSPSSVANSGLSAKDLFSQTTTTTTTPTSAFNSLFSNPWANPTLTHSNQMQESLNFLANQQLFNLMTKAAVANQTALTNPLNPYYSFMNLQQSSPFFTSDLLQQRTNSLLNNTSASNGLESSFYSLANNLNNNNLNGFANNLTSNPLNVNSASTGSLNNTQTTPSLFNFSLSNLFSNHSMANLSSSNNNNSNNSTSDSSSSTFSNASVCCPKFSYNNLPTTGMLNICN